MSKQLSADYPVIKAIKVKMKHNDEISVDQIKGYDRRVRGSTFLLLHVELLQSYQNKSERFWKMYQAEQKEKRRLESCLSGHYQNNVLLKEEIKKLREEIIALKGTKVQS
jgi:hypothetical protein